MVARLLTLVLCLQFSFPLLEGVNLAAGTDETRLLQADLLASLCHDASGGDASAPLPAGGTHVKHCILCLPVVGTPTIITAAVLKPPPRILIATNVPTGERQAPVVPAHAIAHPRGPPSPPRTA